jgi:hypothetical protein
VKAARLAPTADRDAAAAVQFVIDWWRTHDRPPPPTRLGKHLGWDSHDTWALVWLLVDDGWLTIERRGLRPGPKARGPAAT